MSMINSLICAIALALLTACSAGTGNTSPIPAASAEDTAPTAPTVGPAWIYESVMYVAWENGTQSAYYLAGPGDLPFTPDGQWRYLLRGATSNTAHFFFSLPTIQARRVTWRLVWVPQHTRARFFAAYIDPTQPPIPPRELHVIANFAPDETGGIVEQATAHPTTSPRVVDVDVTDAFNAAIATHLDTVFGWQMQSTDIQ